MEHYRFTKEIIEPACVNKMLQTSGYTPSHLTYALAKANILIEDLRIQRLLPTNPASRQLLKKRAAKRKDIWSEFYSTEEMTKREWAQTDWELRLLIALMEIHRFHYKICD
jgi:hypothetical protein